MNFINVINEFVYTQRFIYEYDNILRCKSFASIFKMFHYKNDSHRIIGLFPAFLSSPNRLDLMENYK